MSAAVCFRLRYHCIQRIPRLHFYAWLLILLGCVVSPPLRASQSPTTTTLTLTSNGSVATSVPQGTAVTLTAIVTSNGMRVTPGQVNFCDATAKYCTDIHRIGAAQLTAAGTATLKFVAGPGTHQYNASFAGTNTYQTSRSPVDMLTVNAASGPVATTVGIEASGQQGDYSLLGTVATNGSDTPTGQVSFVDTSNTADPNYVLGTATLGQTGSDGISFYISSIYQTPRSSNGTAFASNVAVGDFNADGLPDVLVTQSANETVALLLGNGDGTFTTTSIPVPLDSATPQIVTGDFNGDGNLDFAVTLETGIGVYLGRGDGTFQPGQVLSYPVGFQGALITLVVADFNGDGIPDLADVGRILTPTLSGGSCGAGIDNCYMQVSLGKGDGTFTELPPTTPGTTVADLVSADFNGDGKADLALSAGDLESVVILLGNGDGTFTAAPELLMNMNGGGALAVADLNGDGAADLVVAAGYPQDAAFVLLGNGDGTFKMLPPDSALAQQSQSVAVADINGDGIPDIVLPNENGTYTSVFFGKGDGTFVPDGFSPSLVTEYFFSLAIADFNGDGRSDIAESLFQNTLVDSQLSQVNFLLGQAPNSAAGYSYDISPVGTGYHYIDAVYAGDGNNGSGVSQTFPLLAERVATTLKLTANPATIAPGQSVTLTATLTPYTAQDHVATNPVVFEFGGGPVESETLTGGVATATATAPSTGYNCLTAVYTGDDNFNSVTSNLICYEGTAQAPTITFTVPNHTYGDPPFAVAAASNSPGAFTYSVVSGPATISGSTVTLTGAGTVVLEASQAASGNYSAGSADATFSVSDKQAQTITFPQPISPVPLGSGSVVLVATASSGLPVTFSVVSGPGVFGGGPQGGNTLMLTGAGTIVVAANQAGNATFSAAPQVTRSIVVISSPLHVNLTAAPNPVFVQNPVALQATLSQVSVAATPTGTVTFADGTTPLATVALSGNTAELVISTLAAGYHSLTATYNGDAHYAPVISPVAIELVEDFSLTSSNPNVTISHGGTATYTLLVGPVGAAVTAQPVALSLTSGAPEGSAITFSTQSVPTSSSMTPVTLTIRTPNYPVGPFSLLRSRPRPGPDTASLALLTFGAGLLFSMRRRRALLHRLACVAVLLASGIAVAGLAGCGTGWKTQRYTLTVTAVSGGVTHTTTLTLTTQCADGKTACPIVQ